MRLNKPIVGMASTPSGNGYWMVASDGGIFAFGDAAFHGSTGAMHLNKPIVGMTATSSGRGYMLVASDGGVFAFGDARFHGSTGALNLKQPIVGIASSHSGNGYFMVAADGGIFAFGDAHFHGSAHGTTIAGIAVTPSGNGYWVVAGDGTVSAFGDAHSFSAVQAAAASSSKLIVGIAASAPMAAATPPALPATHLKFTTQPSPTATGGTDFDTQPSVKVLDDAGATVGTDTSDVTLSITGPAGDATLVCHVGIATAVAGLATFAGCEIDKVGTYTLTATADGLASAESTTVDVSLGPADHLAFTNTAFAPTVSAALLAPQPVVRVFDAGGNVITGINPITLSVTQVGATVTCTNNTVATAASIAEFAGCRLTGSAGSYTLHAAIGVSSVTGTSGPVALNTGVATHLVFTNTAFGAAVNGVNLAPQPRVAVEDAGGNIVTSADSITLSVTGAPGGVAVACTTNPMTAPAGVATFAGCKLTGPAATYTLHASNGTVSGDSGNVVLAAFGTATHLVFTNAALGTALNGAAMTPQPQVTVEDAANNVVTSANSITLSVTGGIPTLACPTSTLTVVATLGVATFAGCNLVGVNGTYTLHAAVGITSLTGVSGNVVLATGVATHLVFTNTAFGAAVNDVSLAPQPEVTVKDAGGNTVTTDDSITLSVNEAGATVNCTTNPVDTSAGIATFAGCNLTGIAATYTLHASDGTVAGDSGNVVLAAFGTPTQLVFTSSAFDPAVNGAALAPQPEVTVEDAAGNTVTTARTIDLSVSSEGAALDCTNNSMPTTAGVATFAGCDLVGADATYSLHAAATVGLGSISGDSSDIVLGTGPATQLFTNAAFGSAVNGDTLAPQPESPSSTRAATSSPRRTRSP